MKWRSRVLPVLSISALLIASVGVVAPTAIAANGATTNTTVSADTTNSYIVIGEVSVTPANPTTTADVVLTTTISNAESASGSADITEISVTGPSTFVTADNIGTLGPGTSIEIPLSTSFESPGQKRLTVTVRGYDADGRLFVKQKPVYVTVDPPRHTAGLSATTNTSGLTTVTFSNYGNLNFTDVEVAAIAESETLDQHPLTDVEPGTSVSTTFDTEDYTTENVTFLATYMAGGSSYQVERSISLERGVDGDIRLTGVETTQVGSTVTLDGDAANIGGTDTQSVLVSVQDTDTVSPAGGSGEYFIGTVEASEFATFELTASISNDTTSVPVSISYLVDGERVTTTQQIQIDGVSGQATGTRGSSGAAASSSQPSPNSSGLPLLPILGVIVLGIVAGVAYYVWTRE